MFFKTKGKVFILLSILVVITIIIVLTYRLYQEKNRLKTEKHNTLFPSPSAEHSISEKNVFEFPVIIEDITLIDNTFYTAIVKLDKKNVQATFSINVGDKNGNLQTGTCEYDVSTEQYTGNNTFFLEDTEKFVKKIQQNPNQKLLLRFILGEGENQNYYKQQLKLLENTISYDNRTLLFSPSHICIAKY